jgi:hypothetical protein
MAHMLHLPVLVVRHVAWPWLSINGTSKERSVALELYYIERYGVWPECASHCMESIKYSCTSSTWINARKNALRKEHGNPCLTSAETQEKKFIAEEAWQPKQSWVCKVISTHPRSRVRLNVEGQCSDWRNVCGAERQTSWSKPRLNQHLEDQEEEQLVLMTPWTKSPSLRLILQSMGGECLNDI